MREPRVAEPGCHPIVLQDRQSVDILGQLKNVELGAHLHWEQIAPHAERSLQGGVRLLRHMQWDFPPQAEQEKLEALTELFIQQFGYRPTSFRAGRYGASRATGALLQQLGYVVDSSATPHVVWTTPAGHRVDYRHVSEQPYYIKAPGNLFEAGDAPLLEVPITIMAQDQIAGQQQAPWLRPTYADRATMMKMVDIVRNRNGNGIHQPLVMMFHNVEVIPGASPYTKTQEDVTAYLEDIRSVLQYALKQGFVPATLTEYARSYAQVSLKQITPLVQDCLSVVGKGGLGLNSEKVAAAIAQHKVSPWHLYIYEERHTRWDVLAICDWAASIIPKDAAILSVGCGMAYNLYWFAQQGYADLTGFDIDASVIAASQDLLEQVQMPIKLSVNNAGSRDHSYTARFDYIEAMNCLMYGENDYHQFLAAYSSALKPGGYVAFDVIDAAYNQMPHNRYHTADKHKPELERRPSEYIKRLSTQEIVTIANENGLVPVRVLSNQDAVARVIYIFQKQKQQAAVSSLPKARLPRVLFYVDAPNWAHDFKSENLIRQLSHRFDCRKAYAGKITRDDIAWSDVIIVYYWMQFIGLSPIIPELANKVVFLVQLIWRGPIVMEA